MSSFSSMGGGSGGGFGGFSGGAGGGFAGDEGFGAGLQNVNPGAPSPLYQAMGQQGLAAQQFGFNTQLQGQQIAGQRGITQLENAGATQRANIAAQASEYPTQVKLGQYNQNLPYFQQGMANTANAASLAKVAGTPNITVGGVYNPQQIQQQVNSANAGSDASTASNVKNEQGQLAGRGFGANSPLAQMLGATAQMGNQQSKTANETQLRQTAAQQNASQLLSSQGAYESALQARDAPYFQQVSSLASMLGSFA